MEMIILALSLLLKEQFLFLLILTGSVASRGKVSAPSARRLIKRFSFFVLYFLDLCPLRLKGHRSTYLLCFFQEYSQSFCTKEPPEVVL